MKIHLRQLYALIVATKPIEPGDTLSHQLMADLQTAGFAKRTTEGWVITETGRLFWDQLLDRSVDVTFHFMIHF